MDSDWDEDKIAEYVLGLLYLTAHRPSKGSPWRAWKGHDWDAMDALFQAGFFSDPKSKAKSVVLSDEGYQKAKEIFEAKYRKE